MTGISVQLPIKSMQVFPKHVHYLDLAKGAEMALFVGFPIEHNGLQ